MTKKKNLEKKNDRRWLLRFVTFSLTGLNRSFMKQPKLQEAVRWLNKFFDWQCAGMPKPHSLPKSHSKCGLFFPNAFKRALGRRDARDKSKEWGINVQNRRARLKPFASRRFAKAMSGHPTIAAKKKFQIHSHKGQQSGVIQVGDSVAGESRLISTWSPRHKPLSCRLPGRSYS